MLVGETVGEEIRIGSAAGTTRRRVGAEGATTLVARGLCGVDVEFTRVRKVDGDDVSELQGTRSSGSTTGGAGDCGNGEIEQSKSTPAAVPADAVVDVNPMASSNGLQPLVAVVVVVL